MHHTVQAVIARFPDRGHAIEDLARTDESFRSLCEDLADGKAIVERRRRELAGLREKLKLRFRVLRQLGAHLQHPQEPQRGGLEP